MAKVSRWAIFLRAFLISLIVAQPALVGSAEASEDQAWRSAVEADSAQAYHNYLSAHPSGQHVRDALLALQKLGAIQGGVPTRGLQGGSSNSSGSLY